MAPASPVIASWPSVPRLAITQSNKSASLQLERGRQRKLRVAASSPVTTHSYGCFSTAENNVDRLWHVGDDRDELASKVGGLALRRLPDDPALQSERARLVRRRSHRRGIVTDDEQNVLIASELAPAQLSER